MSTLSLIQVGDIHYPDWDASPSPTDDKDPRLSPVIKAGVTTVTTRRVLERLSKKASETGTSSLIFMGDFTSRGDPKALRAALHHFSWLCKSERAVTARPKLLLVPGNHDVSRDDAITLGQFAKFDQMARWANEALWCPMPMEAAVGVELGESNSGRVRVFLLNTSLGSWERYLLPTALQELVTKVGAKAEPIDPGKLKIALAGADQASKTRGYYDQLDTPYVSAKALEDLRDAIQDTPRGDAIVVVGHHNLLPQEQPRLSSYAEMLNGGYLRRFLLSLARPIVYLHGHTHVELIEEISDPRNPRAKILSISAPRLEDGFNEISFHFDGRQSVIGTRILPWRVSADRTQFAAAAQDRAACTLQNGTALEPSSEGRALFGKLKRDHRYNLRDIEELVAAEMVRLGSRSLSNLLLELYFWRWVDVDHIGKSSNDWIVYVPNRGQM